MSASGTLRGDRRLPTCECRSDRPRQPIFSEVEGPGQNPDVIKILHPAVGAAERDHGLEFLGNDCLGSISAQPGRRKVEKRGIVDRLESRLHRISETDIDDDGNACTGKGGRATQADTAILQLLADESDLQRVGIKVDAIVDSDREHLAEYAEDALLAGIAKSQQIEVARAAGCLGQPGGKQHGAFQDKAVCVRRAAQPVEQALVNEARQEDVERLVGLAREIEQASTHGCGDVRRRFSHRR